MQHEPQKKKEKPFTQSRGCTQKLLSSNMCIALPPLLVPLNISPKTRWKAFLPGFQIHVWTRIPLCHRGHSDFTTGSPTPMRRLVCFSLSVMASALETVPINDANVIQRGELCAAIWEIDGWVVSRGPLLTMWGWVVLHRHPNWTKIQQSCPNQSPPRRRSLSSYFFKLRKRLHQKRFFIFCLLRFCMTLGVSIICKYIYFVQSFVQYIFIVVFLPCLFGRSKLSPPAE